MKTMTIRGEVSRDGKLRIDVPCELPPGPVEVVLTVRTEQETHGSVLPSWDNLYGLGKEVWQGVYPAQYVRDLRRDKDESR